MEDKKLSSNLAKAILACGACLSVTSSYIECTNSSCPNHQPDIPVEQNYNSLPLGNSQTIISTASGTSTSTVTTSLNTSSSTTTTL